MRVKTQVAEPGAVARRSIKAHLPATCRWSVLIGGDYRLSQELDGQAGAGAGDAGPSSLNPGLCGQPGHGRGGRHYLSDGKS
jgi:hypothetical protein